MEVILCELRAVALQKGKIARGHENGKGHGAILGDFKGR
jgi:hypothetical protein